MSDLNRVTLIGRLGRDAELKYTIKGKAVCKFSIAVNKRRRIDDQWEDEVSFFDIILLGKVGENLAPYLLKGKAVGIDGEPRQERWQQDGQNRSKVGIVASSVQLLSFGQQSQEPEKTPEYSAPDNEEDIPF